MRRIGLVFICSMLSLSALAASGPSTIKGEISIATSKSGQTTAVNVSDGTQIVAQFCLQHVRPLDKPLAVAGKGAVIYVPQPIAGLPPGVKISGPEPIAPALAIVPDEGPAVVFLGKGASAPAGVDLKNARTLAISSVSRQDWTGSNGVRRATSVEACLSPGG